MTSSNQFQAPKRHFMAIGAAPAGRPPVPRFHLLSTGSQSSSSSFVLPQKEKPLEKFPDIYTTCPQLKTMNFLKIPGTTFDKQPQTFSSLQNPPIQNQINPGVQFDPNAPLINPYVFF